MAFQRVPFTVKISVEGHNQGVPIVNTFYAQKAGGYVQSDLVTLGNAVDLWVAQYYRPRFSNDYTYDRTVVRGLNAEFDNEIEDSSSAGAGGVAAPSMPPQVSFAVKRVTGLTGRSARGRIFWHSIPQTAVNADSNYINQSEADFILAAMAEFTATLLLAGFVEVVVQRFSDGNPLLEAVVRPVLNYAISDLLLDTQRRRKLKQATS